MSIRVCVATYGDIEWARLANERALPSIPSDVDIIPIHEPDGTISSSRNAAAAYGGDYDWLCFLDADDELAPGYIAAMETAIAANDNRTLLTPAVQIVRNGRIPGIPHFFKEVPLRQANWLVVGTLIHKDLFWEVGGFDDYPHGLEDWALWSKCARVGATVVKVPDAVYRYWANPDSMHRQLWRDKANQRAEHRRVAQELDEWEAAREDMERSSKFGDWISDEFWP